MNHCVLEQSRDYVVVIGSDLRPRDRHAAANPPWPVLLDRQSAPKHRTWRFRPQVTLIVQDDSVRALDTHGGNFYALEQIGSRMLLATLQRGSEAMVRDLARIYQVPESGLRDDWIALVEQLHRAGLTEKVRLKSRPLALPGRFRIWLRLTLAWLCFVLFGWEKTVRIWSRRSRRIESQTPDECEAAISQVDELVQRIASRHPLNPQCKERALVAWHVLTGMGLPARLIMGVMLYPFTAHAWTECHGRVVGDDRARCEQFVPVATHD